MRASFVVLPVLLFATSVFAAGPVPTKEGQCVATAIKEISTRLEGVADSGDAITYANGIYGVSYSRIDGLKGARAGDAIELCLTEIPDDCPPGDDRGKTYKATDLRTHKHWEAMDSEHICGGA